MKGYMTWPQSCLEPVTQLEPNFDGIVIGWSSPKIVSASRALPPRWPLQSSCVVIESNFDPIGYYVNLSSAVQPSWSEGGTTRHNIGWGPSNDNFIKVGFQLNNWFQTRRFLCEFQYCVRHFRLPTKMVSTAKLNLTQDPMGNSHYNPVVWNHLLNKN
jgi:hypothetical protein